MGIDAWMATGVVVAVFVGLAVGQQAPAANWHVAQQGDDVLGGCILTIPLNLDGHTLALNKY